MSTAEDKHRDFLLSLQMEQAPARPTPHKTSGGYRPARVEPVSPERAARNCAVLEAEMLLWEMQHVGQNRRHLRPAS